MFRAPVRNKGRVVVMTDLSGSMDKRCECHGSPEKIQTGMPTNGWLAMQVTAAVSMATEAKCFGFSSPQHVFSIWEWETGQEPACRSGAGGDVGAGTPTGDAMLHLKHILEGETAGALGVLVTDGQPNNAEACQESARKLYAEGISYVVVIVNRYGSDSRVKQKYVEMFPLAPIIGVSKVEDIANVGEAIAREIN